MKLKIAFAVFIVLAVVGGAASVKVLQIRKLMASGKSFASPPPPGIPSASPSWPEWRSARSLPCW
jgi:hypothetical protein